MVTTEIRLPVVDDVNRFFREFWLRTFAYAMRMNQNLYYSLEKSFLVISEVFETT